jgi:hypothetical protein
MVRPPRLRTTNVLRATCMVIVLPPWATPPALMLAPSARMKPRVSRPLCW